MRELYRFQFTDEIPHGKIAQRLFLAAINVENLFGEAQMRLDAKFRFDRAARVVEIDRSSEVGRCVAKLFTRYMTKEFGDGCYVVERVTEPGEAVVAAAAKGETP
ncbi:MAG TPA: hypothetical protein P5532_12880 [Planctomycetota bacterium]|nr:hypothetical protein [Planctomycetota bacterium]HRT95315.1 hypothetical protein [Planctomycetota bacterium]